MELEYPTQSKVEDALHYLLIDLGRPTACGQIYRPLADRLNLSESLQHRCMDDGRNEWENKAQWARRGLVDKGIMSRGPRGFWALAAWQRDN